jgi:elongation factor G
LPDPSQKKVIVDMNGIERRICEKEKLTVYAYKSIKHIDKGELLYVRVYSGQLNNRTSLVNNNRKVEKINNIFRVRGEEYMQVQSVLCGDIVALQGIKHSFSGDTLLDSKDDYNFQLHKIVFPDPIYTASVEYNSVKDKTKVLEALN